MKVEFVALRKISLSLSKTKHVCTIVVAPIGEAACVVEHLLGPYTGEEHAKRGLVVWEPCLNHTYTDQMIHLMECPDIDEGRRKRARVPDDGDAARPIVVMPLRAAGSGGVGRTLLCEGGCGGAGDQEGGAGDPERVEHARSSSPSSGDCGVSPTEDMIPRATVRATTKVEGAASSFGIAGLPLKESSGDNTPSHVYSGGSADTRVVPPTTRDAIGRRRILFSF